MWASSIHHLCMQMLLHLSLFLELVATLPPWGHGCMINLLAPGTRGNNFRGIIFKLMQYSHCETALSWMPYNLTYETSLLVQVMTCCLMAPSHYLSQCWPRTVSPYGGVRPRWVNSWWCRIYVWKLKNIFAFSIISQHWDGTHCWKPPCWWKGKDLIIRST